MGDEPWTSRDRTDFFISFGALIGAVSSPVHAGLHIVFSPIGLTSHQDSASVGDETNRSTTSNSSGVF